MISTIQKLFLLLFYRNIMEINTSFLLNEIVFYYSDEAKFKKLIEPIILKKDVNGSFDSVELINRLDYTIVYQQRDVESECLMYF